MTGSLPLEGVKVADFSWFGAGPVCSRHMAAFGATVVRIESETHMDGTRRIYPMPPGKASYNASGYFNNFNPGKLSLALNMNTEGGREIALRLIAWADVFLTNITPRVIERWGLTYDRLTAVNPQIVAAYQPMQGYDGPHRDFLGFGAVLSPVTGYSHLTGFPHRTPLGLGTNYPDYVVNPGHALIAILAALRYRRRTGKGQRIECAQMESAVCPLAPALMDYTVNGRVQQRSGNRLPIAAPHGVFCCRPFTPDSGLPRGNSQDGSLKASATAPALADERWIAIACSSEEEWRALLEAMGNPAWAAGPAFATLAARKENEDELEQHIAAWTADRDAYKLMDDLQRRGVPAGVVQNARDILEFDPHMRERGYYIYLDHPETGRSAYDGVPVVLSKTPGRIASPAPLLGQHTEYVCREILGLSRDEIADLVAAGVLA